MVLTMLNERIKELRKKANYTQKELADRLHVTQSTVNCWETGKRVPTVETLSELAKLFKVSANYLLDIAELEQQQKTDSGNVVEIIGRNGIHEKYVITDQELKAFQSVADAIFRKTEEK